MEGFLQSAKDELVALQLELGDIGRRQRVVQQKIHALNTYVQAVENPGSAGTAQTMRHQLSRRHPKDGSVMGVIVAATVKLLSTKSSVHTVEILEQLNADGMAKNTTTGSISSILSRDGRFVASRKYGWALKDQGLASNAAEMQEAPGSSTLQADHEKQIESREITDGDLSVTPNDNETGVISLPESASQEISTH